MNWNGTTARFLVAAAVLWHLFAITADGWTQARKEKHGRDFASYYYAVQVAVEGGDPYDTPALEERARQDRTRKAVYPYFYPPPFLLLLLWVVPLGLKTSYLAWYWLDELFLVAAALALWRWWRPLGPSVGVLIALAVAALTAIPNNHLMGQANMPVLALVIAGLWAEDRDRPLLGGCLVGAACMLKMSPAFFVAWWMLRRRWTAVAAACGFAVLLTLASLPIAGLDVQLHFYTEVLPGFGSGDYNGLSVPISIFGNHSIPDLLNTALPSGDGSLSTPARVLSTLSLLAVVAGTGWAFRAEPSDAVARAAQLAAVAVAMLLVPVYTYEHHLVWAIPAVVISVYALMEGRLGRGWAIPLGLAVAAWAYELAALKTIWTAYRVEVPQIVLAGIIQEVKFAALVILFAATIRLGRSHS